MKPLRILVLLGVRTPALDEAEVHAIESKGWSLHIASSKEIAPSERLLDSYLPHVVHLRDVLPVGVLLGARVRGIPTLLEHDLRRHQVYARILATLTTPTQCSTEHIATELAVARLHFLYLATLNLAFAPPVVRAATRQSLLNYYADNHGCHD